MLYQRSLEIEHRLDTVVRSAGQAVLRRPSWPKALACPFRPFPDT